MGRPVHVWTARTCMDSPYVYWSFIHIWAAHTRKGCPYAYGTAHTCMGKILIWDGTIIKSTLPISIACDEAKLVRKILHPALKISLFVCASHPSWCSHSLIATLIIILDESKARLKTGYGIVLTKLRDQCSKQLYWAYIYYLQQWYLKAWEEWYHALSSVNPWIRHVYANCSCYHLLLWPWH